MDADTSAVKSLASRGDVATILLLGAPFDPAEDAYCSSLLQRAPSDELATITVSFSHPPDQFVEKYRELLGGLPACLHLVSVGEQTRSTETDEPINGVIPDSTGDIRGGVKTVPQRDLTELGVRITESLGEIAERDGVTARSLCFRSLTPLLVDASASTAFKFLQVLRGQLVTHDVVGHFHLDPDAHEEEVITQLKAVFDGIIEFSGDEAAIRSR